MGSVNIINANLKFGSLTNRTKTTHLILHHTASTSMSVEQIHQQHLNQGWAGIGYNFYVRKDGSVYQGRGWERIGAHTVNYNSTGIGICFEGNYETESSMPDAQFNAGAIMVSLALNKYPTISSVCGHKNLNATACPGKNFPLDSMIYTRKGGSSAVTAIESAEPVVATAIVVAAAPTSSSSNSDLNPAGIRAMQGWLNANYGFGLSVDGIYGANTRTAAIKAMQSIIGTAADGAWGPKSSAACPILRSGNTGSAVFVLQGMLYCRGYSYSGVDGSYGPMTVAETKSYQSVNNLSTDGVAGPATFASLFSK